MLYLLRHSYTVNSPDIIQGTDDTIELSDIGRAQAANVATKLKRFNLEYIVSSKITRAQQTAEIMGDALRIPIEYDDRLNEYNYGTLTGESAKGLYPATFECFLMNPVKYFKAEPFESAFRRVGDFLETIDYEKNILVVTHSTILYFIMCYLEDKNKFNIGSCWDKRQKYSIENGDILSIRNLKSGMQILRNKNFVEMKPRRSL